MATADAPLAIRLNGKFYNRPVGFKVRNGRLSFIHLQGSASIPVEDLDANELSQLPRFLRDQIAAEVIAQAKRREEEAKRPTEEGVSTPRPPSTGGSRRPGHSGGLAGPNGSLRFVPVQAEGGGAVKVDKILPKAGGAIGGGTVAGSDGELGTVAQASREVRSAVEAQERVRQRITAADMEGAISELKFLADLTPASKADGEYIDATTLNAATKVFDEAFRQNDPAAAENAVRAASSVGGTRAEVTKFLQGVFSDLCEMAARSEFVSVGRWVDCLEALGPAYAVTVEMGRQRVSRKVLARSLAELQVLHFNEAWEGYHLAKRLWLDNPDLQKIAMILEICCAIVIGVFAFSTIWLINRYRAWRAMRIAAAKVAATGSNWVVRRTDPEAMGGWGSARREPSTRPRPKMREPSAEQ
ncbi:MAG TPA: hypothetical protein PLU30_04475 [Verrucomicrobiae bacterium]|nr:hypothetical protein [Verrucomicrobiae bacterium]